MRLWVVALASMALASCSQIFDLDSPVLVDARGAAAEDSSPDADPCAGGACFPVIQASALTGGAPGSPFTLELPANIESGDLLVALLNRDGGATQTFTWPTGWTEMFSVAIEGNGTFRCAGAYRRADGTEGVSLSVASSATAINNTRAYVIRITGASSIEASPSSAGGGIAPDPPSFAPTWNAARTLWIASMFATNTSLQTTLIPTSYMSVLSFGGTRGSWRALEAASEDPGPFALSTTNAVSWRAYTLAIEPAP